MRVILGALLCLLFTAAATSEVCAAEKEIRVFVALCDNASQGIIPVPAKIGNGDDPERNLYWGCDEALPAIFKHSREWKRIRQQTSPDGVIMEHLEFRHESGARLAVDAYRGSQIQQCLLDFEAAIRSGQHDLVAYIGHNGLMDHDLPLMTATPLRRTDVFVLCCKSADYFQNRIISQGGRPALLTTQLMYPGAFLLRDSLKVWLTNGSPAEIRDAAARGYAKNQRISFKAASGVFAPLK